VRGVLTRNPDWELPLAGFQAESAWMVGAWTDVQSLVNRTNSQTSPIVMARLLLAMRTGDSSAIANALSVARTVLGIPITAAGVKGYRRCYDAVLDLHITHELEMIHNSIAAFSDGSQATPTPRRQALTDLSRMLSARLDASLPTFRTREPILSMRRTAFALRFVLFLRLLDKIPDKSYSRSGPHPSITNEIGRSWLASAKIARKAGQWQTAYSAMLQAEQSDSRFSFMESAKLVKATGEPLRALQELEKSMRLFGLIEDLNSIIDLTEDDQELKKTKAKVSFFSYSPVQS
jgi:serine/threonine-protein kinase ATR